MKKLCTCAAIGILASSALAQEFQTLTERSVGRYDPRTNSVVPIDSVVGREGPDIAWERFVFGPGSFRNTQRGETILDWADVATGTVVNGISVSSVVRTDAQQSFIFALYDNDNGGALGAADPNDPNTDVNDPNNNRQLLGAWTYGPTIPAGNFHQELLIDLEDPNLGPPISMTGPDLDADGRTDFGYSYSIIARGALAAGPSVFGDGPTIPPGSPGSINGWTRFNFNVADPNAVVVPPLLADFQGNFQFAGGTPFGQYALRLWQDGTCTDTDGDGICNSQDGCPNTPDPNQEDSDGDGHGDACDLCPGQGLGDNGDNDADGLGNPCDNCPDNFNPNQADCDADGIGDACDSEPGPGCTTGCPNPGCDDAGVDADFNNDCEVGLTDLATLLANFGTASGATNASGDTDANGDVVLTDLANTLARFGNNCN
ncbi:MAG: thrombospondin type 3 repeat-containing protein [Phycisphaerae bacterium]